MLAVVTPDVEPVRNALRVHNSSHPNILIQTHVPLSRSQYPLYAIPILPQKPLIVHIGQKIRRIVEVAIVVVIPA